MALITVDRRPLIPRPDRKMAQLASRYTVVADQIGNNRNGLTGTFPLVVGWVEATR